MTPERWQQAKAIFQRALELPPDERHGFVSTASAGDDRLAEEVASLLEAHDRTAGFSLATRKLPGLMATTEAATPRPSRRCPKCGVCYDETTVVCEIDGELLVEDLADLSGTLLDETYRVLRVLGRGGMGVVYLAEHVLLHDRVAIKILPHAATAHADSFRRFLREGQMARAIHHPNVVSVLELRTTAAGMTYMVLEYVEGPTLREELRRRERLSLDEAVRLLEPIASALDHAHGLGIVHRDLKPENVIIGGTPDAPAVKLLDLGLARLFDTPTTDGAQNMTTAGQILGTPAYMPPEQWGQLPEDGGSIIDGRTDVYSLGVMLVEMVAGRVPFEGKSLHDIRVAHALETPPRLSDLVPGIPERASEAVARALAKDRAGRQASAGAFLAQVRGTAAQHLSTVSESQPLQTLRVSSMANVPSVRWKAVTAAVILVVVVAAIGAVSFGVLPFDTARGIPPEPRPAAAPVDARTVSVRLLAQRTREGVTRVESFSPGDDFVFNTGDGVRVEAETSHAGYVYVINEAPTLDPVTALPRYTVIYPKPGAGASPHVQPKTIVRVPEQSWIEFFGTSGRETVWVVWSAQPVTALQGVDSLVTPEQLGRITDAERVEAIQQFLASSGNASSPIQIFSNGRPTDHAFTSSGDVIVFPLSFEHR